MNLLSKIDGLGRITLSILFALHAMVEGVFLSLYMFIWVEKKSSRAHFQEILKQIYFTGVQAIWPTLIIATALGIFSAFYSNSDLFSIGSDHTLAKILTQLSIEGLGPLVISFLAIARSCTAIASELGTMKVNHEIDTLRVICKDPYAFLVFPRIFGGCVAVVCLGILFTISLITTFCFALYFAEEVSLVSSFGSLTMHWNISFILFLFAKYAIPAMAIFSVATQQGLSVKRSSHEVPIVTSKAVLQSFYVVFICHGAIGFLQYASVFGGPR